MFLNIIFMKNVNIKRNLKDIQKELNAKYPNILITSDYDGANKKVTLKCLKCGHIWQTTARSVIHSKHGCPKCGRMKSATDDAIKRFKENLDTSKWEFIEYVGQKHKIHIFKVKCKKCGHIRETNANNIYRFGCKNCATLKYSKLQAKTNEQFIKECKQIFGNFYDYSKTEYIQNKRKIVVICPKHGEFKITPNKHLYRQQGCPICAGSSYEKIVNQILVENNINFDKQVYIKDGNRKYFIDFVIHHNSKDYFIEVNGAQHYREVLAWGGIQKFKKQQERDYLLEEYCKKQNIPLIWIKYDEIIRHKTLDILKEITAAPDSKDLVEKSIENGEDCDVNPVIIENLNGFQHCNA